MTDVFRNGLADNSAPTVTSHPHYGPALPNENWVPAPRYLMRRDVILRQARALHPGKILEMGCGAGALLSDLGKLGFTGVGVDQSASAQRIARMLHAERPEFSIGPSCDGLEVESFDHLAAFEVLEHIEDDLGALSDWSQYLKRQGTLMISVPAHPERWNPADVWAGHYRRYTRTCLEDLVRNAGYELVEIQSYGFPLGNIMERLGAGFYARQTKDRGGDEMDQNDRTEASGTDRGVLTRLWPFYSSWPAVVIMRIIWRVQAMFLGGDRGVGYFVIAKKL